jgi:hypothetical protein
VVFYIVVFIVVIGLPVVAGFLIGALTTPPPEPRRQTALRQIARISDIVTNIVGLILLIIAAFYLVINNLHQALIFSLLSLAILVVAKGVLFVLTVFITGAIGGAGTFVGTQVAKKAWDRWNKKEQPPTR